MRYYILFLLLFGHFLLTLSWHFFYLAHVDPCVKLCKNIIDSVLSYIKFNSCTKYVRLVYKENYPMIMLIIIVENLNTLIEHRILDMKKMALNVKFNDSNTRRSFYINQLFYLYFKLFKFIRSFKEIDHLIIFWLFNE